MEVKLTKNKEDWVLSYLTIWQGFLSLTERELELTALLATRYLELQQSVQNPDLLAELLLSPGAKVYYRERLRSEDNQAMSANNLQNYLASLRAKGVLVPLGERYTLEPRLIPARNYLHLYRYYLVDNADLDYQRKMLDFVKTATSMEMEKCWVLHRALTLNQQSEADAWKGEQAASFTDTQTHELVNKYHKLLMSL